ncbi:2-succinyl-6-hydroxy-2,4-cyclohexadiene-1-carboxylate synthase [Shewanella gelidimarina]|uniref:2-succinyl-6-hydroxy-2, 4-cyclohexadiene-1-carboxylate synthase n=1 Tax=Shewanella gelidimarina TaxID=56813 RepID=UPI00200CDD4A|nr:2-succinyl-6-hydroxy-2,4-cyclohexadiene-1-carboxylate synthase [Shewanella gelidimarina]MCL1056580.1 2-succinyl-6-hydroxy-2,4-cyclohexadiene-1-carboxylate synthase [Shewanella gelidimarina]
MLAYQCQGNPSMPAMVLLHGFLGSKADWSAVIEVLAEQYYCISIDLPGHGQSLNHTLPTPGFDACTALIQQTLLQLKIQQYHLVGYSLGGRIALHLARQAPDNILSLILESCHPGLKSADDRAARKTSDARWATQLNSLTIENFLALWYQQAVFADLSASKRQAMIQQRRGNQVLALGNCYQATSLAEQADLWDTPAIISAPCYFIAGSDDQKFLSLATRWQQQYPIAMYSVAASGHNVHSAAPMAFSKQVLQLLKPCSSNPSSNRPT